MYCLYHRAFQHLSGQCNAGDSGDMGSVSGSGRCPGGEHDSPFQYSCLKNLNDRGAWYPTVHRVAESDMTEAT